MTDGNLRKIFNGNGIVEFAKVGDKIDPELHDVLMQVEAPGAPAGHIAAVMKTGFRFHERVLRHAQVAAPRASTGAPAAAAAAPAGDAR
jgi:molecular chaperone GrpE